MNGRRLRAGLGIAGLVALVAACEPGPQAQFVKWCSKYDSSVSRCECIAKKVGEDLSKEQYAQLMTAAKSDTSSGGSFSDFMSIVIKAIGDGKAAVSLTAAAMTCN